jgi:hypothetical protein
MPYLQIVGGKYLTLTFSLTERKGYFFVFSFYINKIKKRKTLY